MLLFVDVLTAGSFAGVSIVGDNATGGWLTGLTVLWRCRWRPDAGRQNAAGVIR